LQTSEIIKFQGSTLNGDIIVPTSEVTPPYGGMNINKRMFKFLKVFKYCYSSRDECVLSTSVKNKRQRDQKGWEKYQTKKHILPVMPVLFSSGSIL
jgi:hypothetical protein